MVPETLFELLDVLLIIRRVRTRLFANVRLASFHDHCNVTVNRCWRNQVPLAVGGFDFLRFEIAAATIFLNGANCSGMAGRRVAISSLLNGQEVSVFVAGRGRTRLFGHVRMVPPGSFHASPVIPTRLSTSAVCVGADIRQLGRFAPSVYECIRGDVSVGFIASVRGVQYAAQPRQ
jgi:hypothetical protein